ncbi:MAG: lysophospholipid acyltransferase family protein [Candidatus Omnitrophica bacterium]|nr:lysophospholipid acyltransferase family protein [Candidatus Omnitrophota bacterium]
MSLGYVRYRLTQRLSEGLPRGTALRLAEHLADGWWAWSARDRAAVEGNLSLIPGSAARPLRAMSREVFRNFGRYLVEFFTMREEALEAVRVEGRGHLDEAQQHGRGTIVLTGHLGNWELGAAAIRRLAGPMSVVALRHADPRLDGLFTRQRQRCALEVIAVGEGAAQRSLARLRQGGLVGLLGDREFGAHGLSLTLFGRRATLPEGPALLSLRSHAPIVPSFLLREGLWRFRLCVEPPIWPDQLGGRTGAAEALTRAYTAVMERYIQQVPTQWLMFQPVT